MWAWALVIILAKDIIVVNSVATRELCEQAAADIHKKMDGGYMNSVCVMQRVGNDRFSKRKDRLTMEQLDLFAPVDTANERMQTAKRKCELMVAATQVFAAEDVGTLRAKLTSLKDLTSNWLNEIEVRTSKKEEKENDG